MEYVIGSVFITGNGIPILYTRNDGRLMYGVCLDSGDTEELVFCSFDNIKDELTNHGWQYLND